MSNTANKQSALDAAAKRKAAERRERMGATYREFWYACRGEAPPGNFYDLPEEARETWRGHAEAAAKALGTETNGIR